MEWLLWPRLGQPNLQRDGRLRKEILYPSSIEGYYSLLRSQSFLPYIGCVKISHGMMSLITGKITLALPQVIILSLLSLLSLSLPLSRHYLSLSSPPPPMTNWFDWLSVSPIRRNPTNAKPVGYWRNQDHQRAFFMNVARQLGFNPENPRNWNSVTKAQIIDAVKLIPSTKTWIHWSNTDLLNWRAVREYLGASVGLIVELWRRSFLSFPLRGMAYRTWRKNNTSRVQCR